MECTKGEIPRAVKVHQRWVLNEDEAQGSVGSKGPRFGLAHAIITWHWIIPSVALLGPWSFNEQAQGSPGAKDPV